jgi:diguanylate cyclase (GGDEF)-like protein
VRLPPLRPIASTRAHWPLLLGLVAIAATLVAFGTTDAHLDEAWPRTLLGVPAGGWATTALVGVVALSAQLLLNTHSSLKRERRLVETGAALRMAKARLEEMARTDAGTGLPNRRAFFDDLADEFQRAQRYGRPLALLMLDLDRFKRVNDLYGHQFGDRVLAETALTLRRQLRTSDLVARYGGEEFVVVLPETTQRDAMVVAEKLRAAVEAQVLDENESAAVRSTVSVGVASVPAPGVTSDAELLRRADEALYEAKRAGRNRVEAARTPSMEDVA